MLEQTVLLHPLKHNLDNIALQEVVYCYHNGEKKTINKGRQTIITLKSVGLSFREIAKRAKVSVSTVSYTIKRHLETGGNSDRKRSGKPKATMQSEDVSESTACVIGGSQDSSFKHSLTLVEVRKSQFQL